MKESCLKFYKLQWPNKCICYRLRVAAIFANEISSTSVKMQLAVRSRNIVSLINLFYIAFLNSHYLIYVCLSNSEFCDNCFSDFCQTC